VRKLPESVEHEFRKRKLRRAIQYLATQFGAKYQMAIMALKVLGLDQAYTNALLEVEKEMRL